MTDQEPSRTRSEMLAEGRDLDRPDSHDSASSILLRLEAQLEEIVLRWEAPSPMGWNAS